MLFRSNASQRRLQRERVNGRYCKGAVFSARMGQGNLLLSNQLILQGIILLTGKKAEKGQALISFGAILKIWEVFQHFSLCFIWIEKFSSMVFPWINARFMKNG